MKLAEQALVSANEIITKTGADAVKLEVVLTSRPMLNALLSLVFPF